MEMKVSRRINTVEFFGTMPSEEFFNKVERYLELIKPSEKHPLVVILLNGEEFKEYIKADLSRLKFWRVLELIKLRVDDEARRKIELLQERYVAEFASHIHGCFRPGRSGEKSQIAINIEIGGCEDTFLEELLHYEAYRRSYFQAEFNAADRAKELFVRTHIDRTFVEKIRHYLGDLSASYIAVEKGLSSYIFSMKGRKLERIYENVKASSVEKYRDPLASFEVAIDLAFAVTLPPNYEDRAKKEDIFLERKIEVLRHLNSTVRERFEEMEQAIHRVEMPPMEQNLLNCYTALMSIYHSLPLT
ncbi:MAG: hypothetical protein QXJ68_07985 [Methanocellales archaeon]